MNGTSSVEHREEYLKLVPVVARMEAGITGMSRDMSEFRSDMSELRGHMAKLSDAVSRIAVIDEKVGTQAQSVERAFMALDRLAKKHEDFVDDNARIERERREKAEAEKLEEVLTSEKRYREFRSSVMWVGGFFAGLSLLGSGFSMYAVNAISNLSTMQSSLSHLSDKVDNHINNDKLTDERSLRQMQDEVNGNATTVRPGSR